eukprot:COSAG02_NODE_2283_length_9230_cov_25.269193_2_plen_248_part_00
MISIGIQLKGSLPSPNARVGVLRFPTNQFAVSGGQSLIAIDNRVEHTDVQDSLAEHDVANVQRWIVATRCALVDDGYRLITLHRHGRRRGSVLHTFCCFAYTHWVATQLAQMISEIRHVLDRYIVELRSEILRFNWHRALNQDWAPAPALCSPRRRRASAQAAWRRAPTRVAPGKDAARCCCCRSNQLRAEPSKANALPPLVHPSLSCRHLRSRDARPAPVAIARSRCHARAVPCTHDHVAFKYNVI